MPIDFAYILAAGKGTRMGEIGKILPKPLWPIFEKSLLELQVLWCQSLGINKIYVNAHFHADQVQKEVNRISKIYGVEIVVLHEDPLLDSGGCIHNLGEQKEIKYRGKFLLVNSDQFYFFSKIDIEKALEVLSSKNTPAVLFSLKVEKSDGYNETILDSAGKLKSIEKQTEKQNYLTYSGLGLIDLEKLSPIHGISKFFETVANYKEKDVYFITPEKAEYWDFGTSSLYAKNIKKVIQMKNANESSSFVKFLETSGALLSTKLEQENYLGYFAKGGFDLEHTGKCEQGKIHYRQIIQDC